MSEEAWFPEPFGPIYERPPGAPCPDCECCTLRLCQVAASKDILCAHQSDDPQTVAGCPCSATAAARARTRTMQPDDEPEPGAAHKLTSQPAGDKTHRQYDQQTFIGDVHVSPLFAGFDGS